MTRSLSPQRTFGSSEQLWQYHSRSDAHSKIQVWSFLFDFMLECDLLQQHVAAGKVVFGVNQRIQDQTNDRNKDLDLVIATPDPSFPASDRGVSFVELGESYNVRLSADDETALAALPTFIEGPVGTLLMAIEAKAAMTAHGRAHPRLFAELTESYQTINGAAPSALAVGLVMVNGADAFLSPGRNKWMGREGIPEEWNRHRQPAAAAKIVDKMLMLRNRTGDSRTGFDGLATYVVSCRNDGTPVELVTDGASPTPGHRLSYELVVHQLSNQYKATFGYL